MMAAWIGFPFNPSVPIIAPDGFSDIEGLVKAAGAKADEEDLRDIMRRMLERRGFDTLVAGDRAPVHPGKNDVREEEVWISVQLPCDLECRVAVRRRQVKLDGRDPVHPLELGGRQAGFERSAILRSLVETTTNAALAEWFEEHPVEARLIVQKIAERLTEQARLPCEHVLGLVDDDHLAVGARLGPAAIPTIWVRMNAKLVKLPDSISTDLHIGSMNAGMKDMLNVMDKFLAMFPVQASTHAAEIDQRDLTVESAHGVPPPSN